MNQGSVGKRHLSLLHLLSNLLRQHSHGRQPKKSQGSFGIKQLHIYIYICIYIYIRQLESYTSMFGDYHNGYDHVA